MSVKKTHCKHGHELTPENLNTQRECKICHRQRSLKYYHNNSEKYKEYKTVNKEHIAKKNKEYAQKYLADPKHKQEARDRNKEWQNNNRDKYLAMRHNSTKRCTTALTNGYVNQLLHARGFINITPEIIQLTRAILLMKREIKNVVNQ